MCLGCFNHSVCVWLCSARAVCSGTIQTRSPQRPAVSRPPTWLASVPYSYQRTAPRRLSCPSVAQTPSSSPIQSSFPWPPPNTTATTTRKYCRPQANWVLLLTSTKHNSYNNLWVEGCCTTKAAFAATETNEWRPKINKHFENLEKHCMNPINQWSSFANSALFGWYGTLCLLVCIWFFFDFFYVYRFSYEREESPKVSRHHSRVDTERSSPGQFNISLGRDLICVRAVL